MATPRLNLFKPAGSDTVDRVVDLNNNFDTIDSKMPFYVCTSATRPTGGNLYDGLGIFEKDTGNVYIWDATNVAWQPIVAYTAPGAYLIKLTKNVGLALGSNSLTTNGAGDVNLVSTIIAAVGFSTVLRYTYINGDAIARPNLVLGNSTTTFPSSTLGSVRSYVGNTAAVIASGVVRIDWQAWGLL